MNREETHALYAQGKHAWNAWAEKMLAEKTRLEAAGQWAVEKGRLGLEPKNDTTRAWLVAASAIFSSGEDLHTFSGDVDFAGFVFPGDAGFSKATFSGDAGFDRATFSGNAGFDKATFAGRARFDRATFSGGARFREATFSGDARFRKATFSGDAWFSEATFSGLARFNEAAFSGNAGFDKATFSGDAWFIQTRFDGYTMFDGAQFAADTRFTALTGLRFFSLRGVTFDTPPDFEQAHFSEAPRLDITHFRRGHVQPVRFWWSRKPDVKQKSDPLTGIEETARWRSLKRLASQGHDHEREQLFFARELQSLRGVTDFPFRGNAARYWFGCFYELFSDFGRSMLRPLLWWGAFTVLFAGLYLGEHLGRAGPNAPSSVIVWATGLDVTWRDVQVGTVALPLPALTRAKKATPLACVVGGADGTTPASAALAASLRKGLLFAGLGDTDKASQDFACLYGLDRKLMAELGTQQIVRLVPDGVANAGLAQTIISTVLMFLFLLATRNQFRIR